MNKYTQNELYEMSNKTYPLSFYNPYQIHFQYVSQKNGYVCFEQKEASFRFLDRKTYKHNKQLLNTI